MGGVEGEALISLDLLIGVKLLLSGTKSCISFREIEKVGCLSLASAKTEVLQTEPHPLEHTYN